MEKNIARRAYSGALLRYSATGSARGYLHRPLIHTRSNIEMVLGEEDIKHAIEDGRIDVDPYPKDDQYDSTSLDLFIGDDFFKWDQDALELPGMSDVLTLVEERDLEGGEGDYLEGHKPKKFVSRFFKSPETEDDGSVILKPGSPVPLLAVTNEEIDIDRKAKIAARVEGRSSLARIGLFVHLTAPTIHAGFGGTITLELFNIGEMPLKLVPGKTRICQLIFERVESRPEESDSRYQGQEHPSGH